MAIEFYQYNDELWFRTDKGENKQFTEMEEEVVTFLINEISTRYPEAYKALESEYSKVLDSRYFRFLIVRRFCKCNFGKLDTKDFDIDNVGTFHFEKVDCPLRGECKMECVVCQPKFNTKLSNAEFRVMKLLYEGKNKIEIADELFISPYTVANHIRTAYSKLQIHDQVEFMNLASKNKMFN